MAKHITGIHNEVTQILQRENSNYKVQASIRRREHEFAVGDLVMTFLKKARFLAGTYHKLKNKKIGHCKIICKISHNAYIIDLPPYFHISPSFNVSGLTAYKSPDEF